jgi:hypothetical protein
LISILRWPGGRKAPARQRFRRAEADYAGERVTEKFWFLGPRLHRFRRQARASSAVLLRYNALFWLPSDAPKTGLALARASESTLRLHCCTMISLFLCDLAGPNFEESSSGIAPTRCASVEKRNYLSAERAARIRTHMHDPPIASLNTHSCRPLQSVNISPIAEKHAVALNGTIAPGPAACIVLAMQGPCSIQSPLATFSRITCCGPFFST